MAQPTLADLPAVLAGALQHTDNAARKKCEEALKALTKNAACVPVLLQAVQESPVDDIRHLAAITLKKRILVLWQGLSDQAKDATKAALLDRIIKEPNGVVRRAVADAVAAIAKFVVPAGQWPLLLQFLGQCSQSTQAEHREVAIVLFLALVEDIPEVMKPHFATLGALFRQSLADASPKVRKVAVRAVGALVLCVQEEEEVALVRELVPQLMQVARASVAANDEEVASLVFEILLELVESSAPVLGSNTAAVLQFPMQAAGATQLELSTRRQALEVVAWLATFKARSLQKGNLVDPLLRTLCPLCSEPMMAESKYDDEEQEEKLGLSGLAAQVVDSLALNLPSKLVLPTCLAFASGALGSADPTQRRAGCAVVAVLMEGCAEALRPKAGELCPALAARLGDPSPEVRGAAAFALGQVGEFLLPECLEHHSAVLPPLLHGVRDPVPAVQERVLYAVDVWMSELEDDVAPYLPALFDLLVPVLEQGSADLQQHLLSATAAAAAAAGHAFRPYLAALVPRLQACLTLTDNDHLKVRARALEVLGLLASADGGREALGPVLHSTMQAALQGFDLDFAELREYAHGFFAECAEALGPDFSPYLAEVVPRALASLALDDGGDLDSGDEADSEDNHDGDSDGDDDGSRGGGSDDFRMRNFSVSTGVMDEKAAATVALGKYARFCGPAFLPHLDAAFPQLLKLTNYFHEMIRSQAYGALASCCSCSVRALGAGNPSVQAAVSAALGALCEAAEDDDDKEAVSAALEGSAEIFRALLEAQHAAAAAAGQPPPPPGLPEPHATKLGESVLAVLQRKATCQQTGESDGEGEEEEDEDGESGEELLLAAVAELLPQLAKAAGAACLQAYSAHFQALMKRAKPSAPSGERAGVCAVFGEVVKEVGPAAAPAGQLVLPLCVREMSAPASDCRRNAAFCAGLLAEHCGAWAAWGAPQLAQALCALLAPAAAASGGGGDGEDSGEADDGTRDNAASAAVRLCCAAAAAGAQSGLPPDAERALLAAACSALPIQEDFQESGPCYTGLCALLRAGRESTQPLTGRLVQVFAQAALREQRRAAERPAGANGAAASSGAAAFGADPRRKVDRVPEQALAQIGATVGWLAAAAAAPGQAEAAQQAVAALPAEERAALGALVEAARAAGQA